MNNVILVSATLLVIFLTGMQITGRSVLVAEEKFPKSDPVAQNVTLCIYFTGYELTETRHYHFSSGSFERYTCPNSAEK